MVSENNFLKDKGVVITGGASGFGKGVAEAYADLGADLALIDINNDLLEETSNELRDIYDSKVISVNYTPPQGGGFNHSVRSLRR